MTQPSSSPFLIGELGANQLLQTLASSKEHPLKVIESFRESNALKHDAANQILPLLDLHFIPRSEVYKGLVNSLREQLLQQINSLSQDKLETLLEQSFPYISFEELQDVPFKILKKLNIVPVRFLRQLSNTSLYEKCPIEVKRQIWQINEELFKSEIMVVLNDYIEEVNITWLGFEMCRDFTNAPPTLPMKRRQDHKILQDIVNYVGSSLKLYNLACHFLRELYVNSRSAIYCTLRNDLLMSMHDKGVSQIYEYDPCHSLSWCLDACVRDDNVEQRRIQEMQTIFDFIPEDDPVVGDISMILANPYTLHTLTRNILQKLEALPRKSIKKDDMLRYMTQLVSLGIGSFDIVSKQNFKFPKYQNQAIKFFSFLSRLLSPQPPPTDDTTTKPEVDMSENGKLAELVIKDPVSRQICMYFILARIRKRDDKLVSQFLKILEKVDHSIIVREQPFIQSLISELLNVKYPPFRSILLDNFLLKYKDKSIFVHKQIVRYLSEAHARIPIKETINYLQKLISGSMETDTKDKLMSSYDLLLSRMGQRLNENNCGFLFEFLGKIPQPMQT